MSTTITPKPQFNISVRALVEHVLRSGDLRFDFMSAASGVAGIRAHQRLQRERPEGYQAEVPIRHSVDRPDFQITIGGRIDGVLRREDRTIVEEIKTTQRPLAEMEVAPSAVHWGQAQCYAYLYALQEGLTEVDVRLTYVHLDSAETLEMVRHLTLDGLALFFDDLLERYLRWAERLSQWSRQRDQSIDNLCFPFAAYRPGQREMAVAVYRTIRDGGQLLAQAATGIGKTMAALYPAIKALGQGLAPKVIFLTARTTGRLAAQAALQTLGQKGLRLKWVSLTAKEKICLAEEMNCTPEACPYARGHYDRLNDALAAAFQLDALTRESIEAFAREHMVCPFEFSLELVNWADCIICDYNYAFDPTVTLKRLFGEESEPHAVLVDEAHNLADRAREMFSAQLSKDAVLALRRKLKKDLPNLYRKLGTVNTWLVALRQRCGDAGGTIVDKTAPDLLVERLRVFLAAAERWLRRNVRTGFRDDLVQFYFEVLSFIRVAEQFGPAYATIAGTDGQALRIKLFCMDPSRHLADCWQRCRAAVLFSATLTPADYFQSILGCDADMGRLDLASPFPPANLAVFTATRISTLYRRRRESCREVSRAIGHMVSQKAGNYLIFFPSYDYLALILAQFSRDYPHVNTLVQTPEMTEQAREAFLSRFQTAVTQSLAGFVVMGGIFGEGIDLKGERLTGAAIVGVGLPGIGPERELIRQYYDGRQGCGFEFAYQYPGINRVLQAAGRVIRSESDRGVVLLIDQRYGQHRYHALLPATWQMQSMGDDSRFQRQLLAFWKSAEA